MRLNNLRRMGSPSTEKTAARRLAASPSRAASVIGGQHLTSVTEVMVDIIFITIYIDKYQYIALSIHQEKTTA
jgi:hypothetical protein